MHRRELRTVFAIVVALAFGTGCGAENDATKAEELGDGGGASCERFVTSATAHVFGPGQNVGQDRFPTPILGAPKGSGALEGSLDVVSLGNGGSVTVEFGATMIADGPGPDFIVFENAFWVGGDESMPFAELAIVEVSTDGVAWRAFPCDATAPPYGSCAGWHPVFANADENEIDPFDPETAGGDAFDLADVGATEARWVRITDRADQIGIAGVFDLDAVGIVHALCP